MSRRGCAANRIGLPKTIEVDYIPFFDADNRIKSTEESIRKLKAHLTQHEDQYAGMIFELIQGEGGYYPGDHLFFKSIIEILKENHIAVWIDEIQTFARTEEPFAFQYYGLDAYNRWGEIKGTLARTSDRTSTNRERWEIDNVWRKSTWDLGGTWFRLLWQTGGQ